MIAAQLHLFVLMSKTREILNVLNLAYKMEYLLWVNDASEPDWAVTEKHNFTNHPVQNRFFIQNKSGKHLSLPVGSSYIGHMTIMKKIQN